MIDAASHVHALHSSVPLFLIENFLFFFLNPFGRIRKLHCCMEKESDSGPKITIQLNEIDTL